MSETVKIVLLGADNEFKERLASAFEGRALFDVLSVDESSKYQPEIWSGYEAAFICNDNEKLVKAWTGHPHLRYADSVELASKELFSLLKGIECEKKFLVELTDVKILDKYYAFESEIEQIYLTSDVGTHRIRKRTFDDITVYFETEKFRISSTQCYENERTITKAEYKKLKLSADNKKHPINKKRYCFMFNKKYFELDVFDFSNSKALLEVELTDENEIIEFPSEIKLIQDVSNDKRYKNNYLASLDYEDCKTLLL